MNNGFKMIKIVFLNFYQGVHNSMNKDMKKAMLILIHLKKECY
jgi:hypothetical protein